MEGGKVITLPKSHTIKELNQRRLKGLILILKVENSLFTIEAMDIYELGVGRF